MSSDPSFETEDDDDFMTYYRQFRPTVSSSSAASFSQASSSSPPSRVRSFRNAKRSNSWYNPKRLLSFKYNKKVKTPPHSSRSNTTSPLQGLSGMLSDKMTFSPENSSGPATILDDSQSRDSGNSSGGSPDWRGVRKRRSMTPSLMSLGGYHNQQQPLGDLRRGWHRSHLIRRPSYQDDVKSIYSNYETARDLMDPADIILESAMETRRNEFDCVSNSIYNNTTNTSVRDSNYYDNFSLPGTTESSEPSSTISNRNLLTCLREESSLIRSPRTKMHQPIIPAKSTNSLNVYSFCCKILTLFKFLLMSLSLSLLCFAIGFVWRSMSCESNRQQKFDVALISESLRENVFGQEAAIREIIQSLTDFEQPAVPAILVLVLVGWLGNGKTLTSSILEANFPVKENLHSFSVSLHFAKGTENYHFLDDLSLLIARSCGYSMVVFDDIDEGSQQATEKIERFISTLKNSQLSSRSNGTLVVLTSNAGGTLINQFTHDIIRTNEGLRENVTAKMLVKHLKDNQVVIPTENYLIANGIPVKVVPFLPLSREHVTKCIEKEVSGLQLSARPQDIENILSEVPFFTADFPVLSKIGCKQVAAKVNLFLGSASPDNQYLSN